MTPPDLALYASSAFASTKSERWMTRAGVWGSPPVAPSGAARSAGGENSLLHEKSPANAELFSWSIGDSNP